EAGALEELLLGRDAAKFGPAMKELAAGCKACHVKWRD
ncbi:MAG: hypothetical protein RLZZ238_1784, partial [Planctomycetota bacterium]